MQMKSVIYSILLHPPLKDFQDLGEAYSLGADRISSS